MMFLALHTMIKDWQGLTHLLFVKLTGNPLSLKKRKKIKEKPKKKGTNCWKNLSILFRDFQLLYSLHERVQQCIIYRVIQRSVHKYFS